MDNEKKASRYKIFYIGDQDLWKNEHPPDGEGWFWAATMAQQMCFYEEDKPKSIHHLWIGSKLYMAEGEAREGDTIKTEDYTNYRNLLDGVKDLEKKGKLDDNWYKLFTIVDTYAIPQGDDIRKPLYEVLYRYISEDRKRRQEFMDALIRVRYMIDTLSEGHIPDSLKKREE